MRPPLHSSPLTTFAEEELGQVSRWIAKVLDDVVQHLTQGLPGDTAAERAQLADLLVALRPLRSRMGATFADVLRRLVVGAPGGAPQSDRPAPLSGGRGSADGLTLVDEHAVSSDVQIAFCVARIKDVAEFELREITAFCAALVGDTQVTTDLNPLKPDLCARALWSAAQCLPDRGGLRPAFMKQASAPLAQELRKVYAAASGRLEDSGIQPAAYKTVIVPAGARVARPGDTVSGDAFLSIEGHTVPDRLESGGAVFRTANDVEYLALIGRIFDHILADRTLPGDVKLAISRLQPSVQRLAADDPTLLDSHDHPMWQLLDAIAWQAELLPQAPNPERAAAMQVAQTLVTHIGTSARQEGSLYRWAADRLREAQLERFAAVCERLNDAVQTLKATDFQRTQASLLGDTQASTLDSGQLSTVPSQLLDLPPAASASTSSRWLASVMPGDAARLYLEGAWVHAQLVWAHPDREAFIWADCRSSAAWSLRAKAMGMLQAEGLALPLQPRSLVQAAARLMAGQPGR